MLHLPHHIRLVLHLGPVITNTRPLRLQWLSVLHTPLPVQCTHLPTLLTLHLLYNIHQMLEVHNIISRIVPVHQFIHLLIFRWRVQGKLNSVLNKISLLSKRFILGILLLRQLIHLVLEVHIIHHHRPAIHQHLQIIADQMNLKKTQYHINFFRTEGIQ